MFLLCEECLNRYGRNAELSAAISGMNRCAGRRASVSGVEDPERDTDADVQEHLRALDDEIARLRKLEAAMDRRIDEAEDERRAIEESINRAGEPPDGG
jgi:hypothetical protein